MLYLLVVILWEDSVPALNNHNIDYIIILNDVPSLLPLSLQDRRKEMTKVVSKLGEDGKVALRNVRRDAMKVIEKLEKDSSIGEDQRKDLEAAVQKLTDEYVKQIEGLIKSKTDELTKVWMFILLCFIKSYFVWKRSLARDVCLFKN